MKVRINSPRSTFHAYVGTVTKVLLDTERYRVTFAEFPELEHGALFTEDEVVLA